jgi:hypothetical protein
VLYAGTLSYNNYYKGGLYRSFDWGDTWEHIAPEVDFIEQLAINSKGDVFIGGGGVLRAGATTVETFPSIIYETYDVVVDHADIVYAKIYGSMQVSYDDGVTFERRQNAPILRLHTGKDNHLYGYDYQDNYVYRSTLPILTTNEQSRSSTNLKLFPNPATDFLTIQLPGNKNSIVSICDVLGHELLKTIMNNEHNSINISNLPSGIYMLKAETSTETSISKFIKK